MGTVTVSTIDLPLLSFTVIFPVPALVPAVTRMFWTNFPAAPAASAPCFFAVTMSLFEVVIDAIASPSEKVILVSLYLVLVIVALLPAQLEAIDAFCTFTFNPALALFPKDSRAPRISVDSVSGASEATLRVV